MYESGLSIVSTGMPIKTLFSFITLQAFAIPRRRKRQFLLLCIFLLTLLGALESNVVDTIPFVAGRQLAKLAAITTAFHLLVSLIRFFVVSTHRKRQGYKTEERDRFIVGVNAIVNALTAIGFIVTIFFVFSIEVQEFLNSIALFAVALTLIFQEYIKSVLNGFKIMFSADNEIGDFVQIHDMPRGVIKNITFTSVHIKTETGDLLYVPNNTIVSSEIINYSKLRPRQLVLDVSVLREQITDLEAFKAALAVALQAAFPTQVEPDKMLVKTTKLTKDEIYFTIEIPTKRASLSLKNEVASVINEFIFAYQPTK